MVMRRRRKRRRRWRKRAVHLQNTPTTEEVTLCVDIYVPSIA